MMRSLNSKREAKKNALLLEQKMQLASAIIEASHAPDVWIGLARATKAIAMAVSLGNVARTPAKVFRLDGKIDKRRHRRYVTKHRRVYKVSNQGHINEQQKNEIMQKTQAALSSTCGN